jgi:enoyl-CoA hydratase/carnithine racemase
VSIEDEVKALVSTIAENAPLTIRATKEMLRRVQQHRRIEASLGDDLIALCYTSQDFKEGVASFLAKRAPRFSGR